MSHKLYLSIFGNFILLDPSKNNSFPDCTLKKINALIEAIKLQKCCEMLGSEDYYMIWELNLIMDTEMRVRSDKQSEENSYYWIMLL